MKESMNKITVTKEEIVLRLVDAIGELISELEGAELLSIGVHGQLGVTLEWLDEDEDGTAENLVVGIICTSGSLADRRRVDETSDFVDYVPLRVFVGVSNSDFDIDEVLEEWNEKLPDEEDDEVDEDNPTARIHRFQNLLVGTPKLWPLARQSLEQRIDQEFLGNLLQLAEDWLGRQQAKLDDEA